MPCPMEAAVGAGGMGVVQEEDEQIIDGTQINCTVIGEFPMVLSQMTQMVALRWFLWIK